jgi:hypothetical protein
LKIVEEEPDESFLFLELIFKFNPTQKETIIILFEKGEELLKIIVATINSSGRSQE